MSGTIKGPIHQQLREALQYIRNTIITEKVIKYPERAEADSFSTIRLLHWRRRCQMLYTTGPMMRESRLRLE